MSTGSGLAPAHAVSPAAPGPCEKLLAPPAAAGPGRAIRVATGEICFAGEMDEVSLASLKARLLEIPAGRPVTLYVASVGGDALESMVVAEVIIRRSAKVVAAGVCASSCANYLLLPAAKRAVTENGLVIFHGGVSGSSLAQIDAMLEAQARKPEPDQPMIDALKATRESLTRGIGRQSDLLKAAGVDPDFFAFFDRKDLAAIAPSADCRRPAARGVVFSEQFLAERGVRFETNLGPKSSDEVQRLAQKLGVPPRSFCFWG